MEDWALERQPRGFWELQRVSQPPRGSKQGCPQPPSVGVNTAQGFHTTLHFSGPFIFLSRHSDSLSTSPPHQRLTEHLLCAGHQAREGQASRPTHNLVVGTGHIHKIITLKTKKKCYNTDDHIFFLIFVLFCFICIF